MVVADPSFIVREAVVAFLRESLDVEAAAACADYDELMAAIESVAPHVVVTDVPMGPTWTYEGIRAATWLRAERPEVGVVILSEHAEPGYVVELFREGSAGRAYLLKDRIRDRQPIISAVRAVARGQSVIDPVVVELLVTARLRPPDDRLQELSPREREILGEIATGKTNGAIAQELHLSKRSVEKHVHAIFTKLGLGDSAHHSPRVKAALMFLADAAVSPAERRGPR